MRVSSNDEHPHVGIDVRMLAYRTGGIAAYGAMLVDGLAALPELAGESPTLRATAIGHVRGRESAGTLGRRVGPVAAGTFEDGPITGGTDPHGPIRTYLVRTPPHHRLEDVAFPLELSLGPRPDLLHSPDFIVPWAWRGAAVATVHDVTFLSHPEYLTKESRRYYGRVHRSVARAERVITVSQYTRRELLALTSVDPKNVRVVHNALRPEIARLMGTPRDAELEARELERVGIKKPFILFVSTIEPRKDVETLLVAFRRLLDQGRDIDLALVGSDGWNSDDVYSTWRALGLQERAHFIGRAGSETLTALYRSARPCWRIPPETRALA